MVEKRSQRDGPHLQCTDIIAKTRLYLAPPATGLAILSLFPPHARIHVLTPDKLLTLLAAKVDVVLLRSVTIVTVTDVCCTLTFTIFSA